MRLRLEDLNDDPPAPRRLQNTAPIKPMNTPTHRQSRATALTTIAFATLVFTTAPAATRDSWPQRVEADWLLAEQVAAQDQLGGLVTTKADARGEVFVQAAVE